MFLSCFWFVTVVNFCPETSTKKIIQRLRSIDINWWSPSNTFPSLNSLMDDGKGICCLCYLYLQFCYQIVTDLMKKVCPLSVFSVALKIIEGFHVGLRKQNSIIIFNPGTFRYYFVLLICKLVVELSCSELFERPFSFFSLRSFPISMYKFIFSIYKVLCKR